MGTKVSAPQPTAEENALRSEQTKLLEMQRGVLLQQQQQQNALMPLFAQQLGVTLQRDAQGNIIGATQDPRSARLAGMQQDVLEKTLNDILHPERNPTLAKQQKLLDLQLQAQTDALTGPQAKMNKEIERLLGEKTLKGLRGELPVDPALERDITQQETTLKDRLRAQFGAGYESSSPGIEALQKFGEGANVLRDQARRGEITLAEQLSLARQGADYAQGGANLAASGAKLPGVDPLSSGGFAFGLSQGDQQTGGTLRQILAGPLGIAGGLGQVASGYQMPIGQLQNNRNMQLQANMANAESNSNMWGGFGSVFGSILSMSENDLKENISKIGETSEGIGIYTYTWKGNPKLGLQLGVMASEVKDKKPEAFKEVIIGRWRHDVVDYGKLFDG